MAPAPTPSSIRASAAGAKATLKTWAARRKTFPAWAPYAATAAIVLEALIIFACLLRAASLLQTRFQADSLDSSQRKSEMIREAWSELAEQGAVLRARLANAKGTFEEMRAFVESSARANGVRAEITGPVLLRRSGKIRVSRVEIGCQAPERKIISFLTALDRIPSVAEVEELDLNGCPKEEVRMKLVLRYREYPKNTLKDLRNFVRKLPAVTTGALGKRERADRLFLPSIVPVETALAGWPRITLDGFSENKALMIIGGEPKSLAEGEAVMPGIIYVEKISVNQALVRRTKDNAEIILTIGSKSYSVRPSIVRNMTEYVLTLQKRAPSDLLQSEETK